MERRYERRGEGRGEEGRGDERRDDEMRGERRGEGARGESGEGRGWERGDGRRGEVNKGEERVGERRGEDSDANQRRRGKKPAAVAFGGVAPYHIDKQATAIVTKLILTSPFSQFSGTNIQI